MTSRSLRPARVSLCEVGLRDGFQFEKRPIPTELKLDVAARLVDAGVKRLQVTSFVHPKWVPQMADAEALVAQLPEREGVVYTGLVLNERGLERALKTRLRVLDASMATNEQHGADNANMSVDEAARQTERMVEAARREGVDIQVGLQTVWGYAAPEDTPLERVVALAERFAALGVESISLADSTGMANPDSIRRRVEAVRDVVGGVPLVLHLHDTRGLGMANVAAALECGVDRFDTALGGMGGCPFIPGATGNIATEDTAYLLDALGVETGVAIAEVARASRRMEAFLGARFSGTMHRLLAPAEAGDASSDAPGDASSDGVSTGAC